MDDGRWQLKSSTAVIYVISTAFMVQTFSRWMSTVEWLAPWGWAVWVVPLAIGMPLSILWERHYHRKFAQGRGPQAAQVATAMD